MDHMSLHAEIRDRLLEELGERPQMWLAEQSGIPQSTLATQINKPFFSVEVLVKCAQVLRVDVGWLIRGEPGEIEPEKAQELLGRIERLIAGAKSSGSRTSRR